MSQLNLQRKAFSATVKARAEGQPEGVIEAIVSVFDVVDYAGERMKSGAFSKSLGRKFPKGVWSHDWQTPVAKTLEARELLPGDALLPPELSALGGLYIKGQFNLDTQRGREAYSDLQFGIIDEFSIGYVVTADAKDGKVRDLVEVELFEWSPVLSGMNPATQLLSVKAGVGRPVEQKAQYLGSYVEGWMTIAALREATDALYYEVIYDQVLYSDALIEERVAVLEAALEEYRDLAVRVVRAILVNPDDEVRELAAKSLRGLFAAPPRTAAKGRAGGEAAGQQERAAQVRQALIRFEETAARLAGVAI